MFSWCVFPFIRTGRLWAVFCCSVVVQFIQLVGFALILVTEEAPADLGVTPGWVPPGHSIGIHQHQGQKCSAGKINEYSDHL